MPAVLGKNPHAPGGAVLGLTRPGRTRLKRDGFSSNRHPASGYCRSMMFSENRYPLFGIMLQLSVLPPDGTGLRAAGCHEPSSMNPRMTEDRVQPFDQEAQLACR